MMTDSMKPEDEVKVGLINAFLEAKIPELISCMLCGREGAKENLAWHWENNCPYFQRSEKSACIITPK